MRKILGWLGASSRQSVRIRILRGDQATQLECAVGDNLMDVTNKMVNQDVNIYGLCDKQLACTTCKVDIETHYEHLPAPTNEEEDVLITTKMYQVNRSRMACQIKITEQLDGMVVRINEKDKL